MHKTKLISAISILLIPIVLFGGYYLLGKENFYITCVSVLILSMIPFFASLESKKLKAREIVIISSLVAIAVAGRAAFYALPQIKPTCAVVIITAIVFGSQAGFVTGVMSMLLSNFIFGQGMWTPFQMFGMGLCGLICGIAFHKKEAGEKTVLVAITGAAVCFFVYGITADMASVLMLSSTFDIGTILSIYSSGAVFNLIHALTTFVILLVSYPVFKKVLVRIKTKYGIFGK